MIKPVKAFKKRKKKLLRFFSKPVTQDLLKEVLYKLDIKKGDIVFVHSALSTFGNVAGGANLVIDTLLDTIGKEGTLVLPGFNIAHSMTTTLKYYSQNNIYDYHTTIPTTGIICRVFKNEYNPSVSIHPTHSVLAKGKFEKEITQDHYVAESTFGKDTPLYKLLEYDAKIIGLGSNLGRVTFYHVIEDIMNDFPISVYEDTLYKIKLLNEKKEVIQKEFKAHRSLESRIDNTIKGAYIRRLFWNNLKKRRQLKSVRLNQAKCWSVKAKDVYNYQKELITQGITIYTEPQTKIGKVVYHFLGLLEELNS